MFGEGDLTKESNVQKLHIATPRFADNALVALALLIAESGPGHKQIVIQVILNLLGDDGA